MHTPDVSAALRWIGGPTLELRLGAFRLLTDPVLADGPVAFRMNGHPSTGEDDVPIRRNGPVPPLSLERLDALLLSHIHSDHFDAAARERLPRDLWGLAPGTQIARLEEWGFETIEGAIAGEEQHIERGGEVLRMLVLPARHSHDEATRRELGDVNGYLIEHQTVRRTLRLVWTGDTVWFDELGDAACARGPVDVLIPHLGAVGRDGPWGLMSMDAAEAERLIARVAPRVVVPAHHHTFSHYVEPVGALVDRLAGGPFQHALRLASEGEVVKLD